MIENKPSFVTKRYVYTNLFVDQVEPLSNIIGSNNQYTGLRKYDDLVAIIQGYINNNLLLIPSGTSYTFQNAITETSGIVELGGSLLKNTIIDGNNSFGIALNNFVGFSVNASGIDTVSSYLHSIAYGGINFTTDTLELTTAAISNATATNGQVLTLLDNTTGECEWQTLTVPNLTYQNGLTKTLNVVELGGNLLHHTEINGVNTYNMQFRDIETFTVSSNSTDIYANSVMLVRGLDTSIQGSSTLSLNTPNVQNSLTSLGQVFTLIDPLTGSGEWKSLPSICEQLDTVPTGTYSQGISVLSHSSSNIPSTWIGLEFDYPAIFSACNFSTNISDFYFVDFQHCTQTIPATPISVLDVTAVQNFIDNTLIPDLITCYGSGSVAVGDIIYTVSGSTIVVYYNPLYPPTNNNWVFGDVTGSGCEKQSPSIPTVLPLPSGGGCSLVKLPIKTTEYFDLVSGAIIATVNTPIFIYGVYRNGVFQREGASRDYTVSGTIITFNIPLVNDDISVVYEY